jgi:hypothetical protein
MDDLWLVPASVPFPCAHKDDREVNRLFEVTSSAFCLPLGQRIRQWRRTATVTQHYNTKVLMKQSKNTSAVLHQRLAAAEWQCPGLSGCVSAAVRVERLRKKREHGEAQKLSICHRYLIRLGNKHSSWAHWNRYWVRLAGFSKIVIARQVAVQY